MANPGELLRSAAWNKKHRPAKSQRINVKDAPVVPEQPQRIQMVHHLQSGHSAYSALMRSHDRVRSRIGR